MSDGARDHEVAVALKQNTEAVVRPALELTGTAKGSKPIIAMRYQVVSAGVPGAAAGGFYRVFVKATDNANGESEVIGRTVFYVVPSDLTVIVSGSGDVPKGFAGTTSREIGATYTLTAKPKRGSRFTGWTGSVTSSAPTITFAMAAGFSVQANFQ